jgi:hypothetical protein
MSAVPAPPPTVKEFFRDILESPKVIARWIQILETGKPSERAKACKIAERHWPMVHPSIREAVLAARARQAVAEVSRKIDVEVQIREPR